MPDAGMPRRVGYCTNVHAGATLQAMLDNLRRWAPAIRDQLGDPGPLPIGLWLSRDALDEARPLGTTVLSDAFQAIGVEVFTLNGFPFGDFHGPIVKRAVYAPNWSQSDRLVYTLQLAGLLSELVPTGHAAGISTLPVAWGDITAEQVDTAAAHLRDAATWLSQLESKTGTCIHLDLEPEPGCLLQRSTDVVSFFENHLLAGGEEEMIRRHVRVCHDVCHAPVMFETQADVIATYDGAGIDIGKVQLSSAVQADGPLEGEVLADLREFAEPRWLHQTSVRTADGQVFHEDLPEALSSGNLAAPDCWRVHFHVPVHLDRLGHLSTTQADLLAAIELLAGRDTITDWEVETYAWGALPSRFNMDDLATGIAAELAWVRQHLERAV